MIGFGLHHVRVRVRVRVCDGSMLLPLRRVVS